MPPSTLGFDRNGAAQEDIMQLGRRYFSRLDLLTNPAFLVDERQCAQIAELLSLLKHRVLLRCTAKYSPSESPVGASLESVRQISRLLLELIENHFGSPLTQPDHLNLVEEAHDLFSWGGLANPSTQGVRAPNNVPDSATIFFFPEFAHLAYESGCDAEIWRCLMPIFVKMPALYLKVHELCDKEALPKHFDDFGLPPYSSIYESRLRAFAKHQSGQYRDLDHRQLTLELDRIASSAFLDRMH